MESCLTVRTPIINAMTVDVEDYFQVSAFEHAIARDSWSKLPSRVEVNLAKILDLFDLHGIKATFFVLGWVAEFHPRLVRRIVAAGHEVASHGYDHTRVGQQTPEQFRRDVLQSRNILEQQAGQPVIGYRAASFSINQRNLWALDILQQLGFCYSSSIYPGRHDHYGLPGAPSAPFRPVSNTGLLEIPVSSLPLWRSYRLPCAGGGFFRLYPYWLSRWAIGRFNRAQGAPLVFYFHPWELDSAQPRQLQARPAARFRHYLNLEKMPARLSQLLKNFRWGRMDAVFGGQLPKAKDR